MSSETPVPRTAVPDGITDPVVKARTELKAALAAIEDKTNVPRRMERAADRARRTARAHPVATVAVVVATAAAAGALAWSIIRSYTR